MVSSPCEWKFERDRQNIRTLLRNIFHWHAYVFNMLKIWATQGMYKYWYPFNQLTQEGRLSSGVQGTCVLFPGVIFGERKGINTLHTYNCIITDIAVGVQNIQSFQKIYSVSLDSVEPLTLSLSSVLDSWCVDMFSADKEVKLEPAWQFFLFG